MERRPDPAPLEVNDVAIVGGGTALWAVGLVVLLALKATDVDVHPWWIGMCAMGTVLGLYGVRYCRRRKRSLHRA